MALDENEISKFIGATEQHFVSLEKSLDEIRRDNIDRAKEQGERIGVMEDRLRDHETTRNGNSWKGKAATVGYGGGAGGLILVVEYLVKHLG